MESDNKSGFWNFDGYYVSFELNDFYEMTHAKTEFMNTGQKIIINFDYL